MIKPYQIQLFLIIFILGFLAGPKAIEVFQRIYMVNEVAKKQSTTVLASEISGTPSAGESKKSAYEDLALEAQGVFVWDIKTSRKLFGYNENVPLPLASVSKMMLALSAAEILSPETRVIVSVLDLAEEGDSGLYADESWRLKDLLDLTLVASANDGASAVARTAGEALKGQASSTSPGEAKKLFIDHMNKKAANIGLTNTLYRNETGLDIEGHSGASGSARDVAMLFEYIWRKRPLLFTATTQGRVTYTSESGLAHTIKNTNAEVERVPGLIGSKTGFTDLALGNLALIVDIGIDHPVVIVVLGSTREGRFTDVEKLLNATITTITQKSNL